jgi:hypothetical protein
MKFKHLRRGMFVKYRWDDCVKVVMIIDYDEEYNCVDFTDVLPGQSYSYMPRDLVTDINENCSVYTEDFDDRFSLLHKS